MASKHQSKLTLKENETQTDGMLVVASRWRKLFAATERWCLGVFNSIEVTRAQKTLIETELYKKRYRHSSKNDDDLPIIR